MSLDFGDYNAYFETQEKKEKQELLNKIKKVQDRLNNKDKAIEELPVCISKTPASITDDPKVLGAPKEFVIHIREIRLFAGAGFIVPLSGSLLMLPGLGKTPRLSDDYQN